MIRWIPYTFVRTVAFFIAGIVAASYFPDLISFRSGFVGLPVVVLAYFILARSGASVRRMLNPGWIALPLVAGLGYLHLIAKTESRYSTHLLHHRSTISHYQAVVVGYAEERRSSWRVEARVLKVYDTAWHLRDGRVLLYFSKEFFAGPFRYGDILLIAGTPNQPAPPANPGAFDYAQHLARRNIWHQHFLRGNVITVGKSPPSRIVAAAYSMRERAEGVFRLYVPGERAQAIARALVLGVTDGLDNELRDAYAGVGVMHILAVSGLHVGVIYFVLASVLRPLNRLPTGKWAVAFVSIAVLWLYAFVTGLSASVLRAVTMFSFLTLAKPWRRGTNVYNTLAVSAFVMLLVDPMFIFSVGFQLSYLAVLGIVYYYPRFIGLWEPEHRLAWECWKASTVSVAAQLTTTPLGLLHFQQIPVYFLPGNLVVVPCSSIVLIGGLTLLPVSAVPAIATFVGKALAWVIEWLNAIVFFIERLPGSIVEGVYISSLQCLLLYGVVIAASLLFQTRRFVWMIVLLALTSVFSFFQWVRFAGNASVARMVVYKVPGSRAIDFIDRGQAYFVTDSTVSEAEIDYHIQPHRVVRGVGRVHRGLPVARELKGCTLLRWNKRSILLIDDGDFKVPAAMEVDWVVIGRNAVGGPQNIFDKGVRCSVIILDNSNAFFYAARFLAAAKLHKLEVYSVPHDGAYVTEIQTGDA